MKTAITGQDKDLASSVACHFGRCCFFHIYNDETDSIEILENNEKGKRECASEYALKFLIERDVKHIVSANFGTRVQKEMVNHDIKMTLLTDCRKTIEDIIHIMKKKQITSEL